jgi:protein TonB
MFADSFLEAPSWANRSHRGWTTFVSFAAQALAVGALFLVPLLYTQGLPQLLLHTPVMLEVPASAPAPPVGVVRASRPSASNLVENHLMVPTEIPHNIANIDDHNIAPIPNIPSGLGVAGSTGTNWSRNGVLGSIGVADVVPPPRPVTPPAPKPSVMMEGNLIHRVEPSYPPLARQARIQGTVVLFAVISRAGTIENLKLISGHPMLAPAALDAVRQWRYRPYVLNGEPVEVDTQVTVNFVLSR